MLGDATSSEKLVIIRFQDMKTQEIITSAHDLSFSVLITAAYYKQILLCS